MAKQLYTCIAFFPTLTESPAGPQKFRNVNSLVRFEKFALKKGFIYYNIYLKPPKWAPVGAKGEFVRKVWIPENFPRNKK